MGPYHAWTVLVMLSFPLVLIAAKDNIIFPSYEPPIINPNHKEMIITVGNKLELDCKGKFPLTWQMPGIDSMVEGVDYPNLSISAFITEDPNYPYGLSLKLWNISTEDVGYYVCYYNTSDNREADTITELENTGQGTSIYLFVDDPEHLMVPMELVLSGTQYQFIVFPCRPSSPNVYVTLYRKDGDDYSQVVDSVSFDQHKGFEYQIKSITENHFTCKATRNDTSVEHDFYLTINSHASFAPKPEINDSFNGKSVVGGEIRLDCSVHINPGIAFHLNWTYPNTKIDPKRIFISNTTSQNKQQHNNEPKRIGLSSLIIRNVTKEDQGKYTCEIIDANKNQESTWKSITVKEIGESEIKLIEPAGLFGSNVSIGDLAQWIVHINAFPLPKSIIWYDRHKNEISGSSSNTKYAVKSKNTDSKLRINNVTLADAGVYEIKVANEFEDKSLNFTLLVTAPPVVNLDSKKFYLHKTNAHILCSVEGFPPPKISWYFKPCITQNECQNTSMMEISENQYTYNITDGYKVSSIVTMYVNQSGYLMCKAENTIKNKVKTANSTSVFYVSDIEDGFGIIGKTNKVAVGDNITITCIASIYSNFTGAMNWYKTDDTIIDQDTKNGFIVAREDTEYSYRLRLSIPKVDKSHTNDYVCRANTTNAKDVNSTEEKLISLEVLNVVAPEIYQSNMNNSELCLPLGTTNIFFFCHAKGIPLPTIKWFKDDKEIATIKNRITFTDQGNELRISSFMEEDKGKYICKATSRISSVSKYIILTQKNDNWNYIYLTIILVLASAFVFLISCLIWKIRKEKKIRKELSLAGLLNFEEGATESMNPELGVDEQAELLPYDKKWEFPREKLKLGKQLGSGAFGVVMKASAHGIVVGEESSTVAVKMVKKTAESTFIKALASELKIMVHLGKHLNVVNLLGACTKNVTKRELLVIVEYCRFGNIHNYLLRHRENFIDQIVHSTDSIDPTIGIEIINRAYSVGSNKSGGFKYAPVPLLRSTGSSKDEFGFHGSGPNSPKSPALDTSNTFISMVPNGDTDGPVISSGSVQPEWRYNYKGDYNYNQNERHISTQDLLCWSFQVARGMEYLANRKVLHGDLAARNILLADDNIVKICDFGLAKSMYKNENYTKKGDGLLPVKWMAIESIRDRVFSTQSDVWSYGIVLWELFSLANTPYPGMDADEKFYNRLIKGYRMDKPQFANKQIYQTMLECWRAQPTQRPSFTDLAERLGVLLEDSVRKHYIDLNDPYMDMNSRWMTERGENDYLAMMSSPDYGNLVAVGKHDYVNDPFGGPTSVNPLSPDDTDAEGYLCMSPAKTGVVNKDLPIFDFSTSPNKTGKISASDQRPELIPMLTVDNKPQRPNSDSDLGESLPTSPNPSHGPGWPDIVTSFANPSYQPMFKLQNPDKDEKNNLIITNDNYVNMSQKDSGFGDSLDTKISSDAFTNPSYVTMTGNKNALPHMYNNIPQSQVV